MTTRRGQVNSRFVVVLAHVGDGWERTARFPWGERDVLDIVRDAVRERVHHLDDVSRVLSRVG